MNSPPKLSTPLMLLLASFILLFHFIYVSQLISSKPLLHSHHIVQDDYSIHLANSFKVRSHLRNHHRTWGYDPSLMAGYPSGTIESSSNKSAEILSAILPFTTPPQAFALSLLLLLSLPPILGLLYAKLLELPQTTTLLTALLFALLTQRLSYSPRGYLHSGMYAHALLLSISPPAILSSILLLQKPNSKLFILNTLLHLLGLLLHLFYAISALLPITLISIYTLYKSHKNYKYTLLKTPTETKTPPKTNNETQSTPKSLPQTNPINNQNHSSTPSTQNQHRKHPLLLLTLPILSLSIALLTALLWIKPLLHHQQFATRLSPPPFFNTTTTNILYELRSFPTGSLLLLSLIFLLRHKHSNQRSSIIIAASSIATIAILGPQTPILRNTQPGRFLDLPHFILLPFAILCVQYESQKSNKHLALMALITLLALAPSIRHWNRIVIRGKGQLLTLEDQRPKPKLPRDVKDLVKHLQQNTKPTARLLIEDSDHLLWGHRYGNTHIPALIPAITGLECIGGPTQECRLTQHFTDFSAHIAFDKALDQWPEQPLLDYCQLYNIGWAVCWSPRSQQNLTRRPSFTKIKELGRYTLFRLNRTHSFVEAPATAQVSATYDLIRVRKAQSPNGTLVLKYHWLDGFRSEPPLNLGKVYRLNDPVPFITVKHGPVQDFDLIFDP